MMIWPAILFNLCVGLLLAGYLLRAVRRFERRADAIMTKLDQRRDAYVAELDRTLATELHKYDIAREDIRAALRARADAAIAEINAQYGNTPNVSSAAADDVNQVEVRATAGTW